MRKSFVPRFLENGWYSLYYISFFCFGSYVYSQESWSLFPTMNIWLGWPTQAFPRKDFNQMLTHHVTTFFLVGVSYWYRYHRIGLAILWIHNLSDIFLYSAKSLNYMQKESKNKTLYLMAETLFVLFAVSFFLARLIFFPFTLVRSTLWEAYYVSISYPLFYPTNVALLTLLLLHMFWFYLILRIVYNKLIKGNNVDDIRSDSEDEDERPSPKTNISKGGKSKQSSSATVPSHLSPEQPSNNRNNNKPSNVTTTRVSKKNNSSKKD
eukprot:gene628-779_t